MKKGKFTVEEVNRIRQAIENKEDQKHVAAELGRTPVPATTQDQSKTQGRGESHWERYLQPWLLQHCTGTSDFRVERMLTRFVAENFSDYRGIDWSEIVNEHKEFVGHTSTSLRQIYHKVIKLYKEKCEVVSVQEVAAYAEKVYQPGKERRELVAKGESNPTLQKKIEGARNNNCHPGRKLSQGYN